MGQDEVATLRALKAHRRELVDPTIARHHGRIVPAVSLRKGWLEVLLLASRGYRTGLSRAAKSYWAVLGQKWRSVVRYKHVSFGSSAGVASSKPGICFWPLNDYPRR